MYKNKCTKCGAEFETKNPKRVICPGCLYPDRKDLSLKSQEKPTTEPAKAEQDKEGENLSQKSPGFYIVKDTPSQPDRQFRPAPGGFRPPPRQGGYNSGGDRSYNNNSGGYNSGGYNNNSGGYNSGGGFRRPQQQGYNQQRQGGGNYNGGGGGFRRPPQQGGYQGQGQRRPPFQRDNRGGPPQRRPAAAAAKKLLISKEQVFEIENLYKAMLPLPNPDCHEVIGEKMGLESNKVFFGINLVRQKMKLPKLPFPKRKLALSPDQLIAIKNLYTPLLPLPPIGCHKFLAKQLKMDEWRVHVGIGIVRKQMNLPRWNTEREDAPAEFKNQQQEEE